LALVELQNGDAAPNYVASTSIFDAVTRYDRSSYYAIAVIEPGQAVRRVYRAGPRHQKGQHPPRVRHGAALAPGEAGAG
jgi:hypothetical protein